MRAAFFYGRHPGAVANPLISTKASFLRKLGLDERVKYHAELYDGMLVLLVLASLLPPCR